MLMARRRHIAVIVIGVVLTHARRDTRPPRLKKNASQKKMLTISLAHSHFAIAFHWPRLFSLLSSIWTRGESGGRQKAEFSARATCRAVRIDWRKHFSTYMGRRHAMPSQVGHFGR